MVHLSMYILNWPRLCAEHEGGLSLWIQMQIKQRAFPSHTYLRSWPPRSLFLLNIITLLERTVLRACNLGCATILYIDRYSIWWRITNSTSVLLLWEGVEKPRTYANSGSCSLVCASWFSANPKFSPLLVWEQQSYAACLYKGFPSYCTWSDTLNCNLQLWFLLLL